MGVAWPAAGSTATTGTTLPITLATGSGSPFASGDIIVIPLVSDAAVTSAALTGFTRVATADGCYLYRVCTGTGDPASTSQTVTGLTSGAHASLPFTVTGDTIDFATWPSLTAGTTSNATSGTGSADDIVYVALGEVSGTNANATTFTLPAGYADSGLGLVSAYTHRSYFAGVAAGTQSGVSGTQIAATFTDSVAANTDYAVQFAFLPSAVSGTAAGATAAVAVDAPAGIPSGDGTVTGVTAAVSADAPAGTPAGTGGGTPVTLWGQPASPASIAADVTAYTMGVQFSVSTSGCTLTGIWFYSATGAANLPGTIALYAVSGSSLVASHAASWSGAAGSGWVRASFTSPPSLTSGTAYKACVLNAAATGNWYASTAHYWDTGAGASGITNSPVTAPDNAGTTSGQDSYNASGTLTYPGSSFNATNYWVDPEVTPSGGGSANVTGAAAAIAVAGPAGTPSGSAGVAGVAGSVQAAAPAGTPAGSANVTGAAAAVAIAAPAGTPHGSASVTGVTAQVTAAAGAGAPSGTASVTGTSALVNVAAPAGTPAGTGGGGANVTGVPAAVTAAGGAGTPAGSANVAGVAALVLVTAGAGTLQAAANAAGTAALIAVAAGPGTATAGGPFTVGVLTATDVASATLTAADSGFTGGYPGTYTPAYPDAAAGVLTASDQRTGGPG